MLKKENRLKKKRDFERVLQKGRGYKGDSLFLKVIKNEEAEARIGIIVSKKVSKKAVERNKLRRRIREIVRTINLPSHFDAVVVAFPKASEKTFQELSLEIINLFKKANV